MNIIMAHNFYQQTGGEDQVFRSESNLLESKGHKVIRYTTNNDCIENMNNIKLALNTLWNERVLRSLKYLVRRHSIKVIHFHNTFPLISPGSYYVKRNKGPVVIQTLHNFRLLCPGALFLRNGNVCEECLFKSVPWPGAVKACYRKSFLPSVITVAMLTLHRLLRTWHKKIDRFIALTEFSREKFIQGGIPPEKIAIKPNFVSVDPGFKRCRDGYALYVGRLSDEKGVTTLLKAWKHISSMSLKIVGYGPLEEELKKIVTRDNLHAVEVIGQRNQSDCINLMKRAMFLLFPSKC